MAEKPKLVEGAPAPDVGITPEGLGPSGVALWTAVQTEYRIVDCGGAELLRQACRAADMATRLRARIDADGLMIEGQNGNLREHPCLKLELGHRAFIVATLKKLGVTDEPVRQLGRGYKSYA